MTNEQQKKLIKAQQGELDAVILYKKLAEKMIEPDKKEQLQHIAADEGKHASILKNYTKEVLKPEHRKAKVVLFLYKVFGQNITFRIISTGELKSLKGYRELVENYPDIKTIMNDELRHAGILKSMIADKK